MPYIFTAVRYGYPLHIHKETGTQRGTVAFIKSLMIWIQRCLVSKSVLSIITLLCPFWEDLDRILDHLYLRKIILVQIDPSGYLFKIQFLHYTEWGLCDRHLCNTPKSCLIFALPKVVPRPTTINVHLQSLSHVQLFTTP